MTRKPFAVSNGRPASKFAAASTSPKPKIVLLNKSAPVVANSKPAEPETVKASCGDELAAKLGLENAEKPAEPIANAGNAEGARKGWLTRKGGMREDHHYVDEAGQAKTKLTIQGQQDGQKDIELHLPTATVDAIKSGKWEENKDWSKHAGSENFHTIHGYTPTAEHRAKYPKGSEADKHNAEIGQAVARANAYYVRSRDYDKNEHPHKILKAKAEELLARVHGEMHGKRKAAQAAHDASAPVANRGYHALLNSFRAGALLNYVSRDADVDDLDDEEVIELAGRYAAEGDTMPDDLVERLEEIMSNREQGTEAVANRNITRFK